MATLEKIRTRGGVFIAIIIGIALLSFIISPDSLQQASMLFSSKYDAGEIAGKSISYQSYQERVDQQLAIYEANVGGKANVSEQDADQIREQVWQAYINEYVMQKEFEKVGLFVSDEELNHLVTGNNPAPLIQQLFTNQQTGIFDRSALIRTIQNLDADPAFKSQWIAIEEQVRESQMFTKYSTMIDKSMMVNSIDLKDALDKAATSVEFSYIVKPYMVIDTTTSVSNSDLKNYYNEHKKSFKQNRSRDIQYVAVKVDASPDDYLLTMNAMQKIEADFINTPVKELGTFVSRNSDKAFDNRYYGKGQLAEVLDTFAFNESIGAFLPLYQDGESYNMSRISDIKNLPDSVRARHILLSPENYTKVDSLIDVLKSGKASFSDLAAEYGTDGTANNGGDLDWFAFDRMVRPFSDSAFYNPKGKIMRVNTQFGVHILEVTDRGPEKNHVQIATIQLNVTPGKTTSQNRFNEVNSIATELKHNKNKTLAEVAAEKGVEVIPATNLGLNDRRLGNFNQGREIIRWAYNAEIGDVSDVFDVDNSYFVVAVLTKIHEEGIPSFDEVKSDVERIVKKQKQADLLAKDLSEIMQSSNTIDEAANKAALSVMNVNTPVSFSTQFIPGIMLQEPKLVGAVTSANENTLGGPVKGEAGVYVFSVSNKTIKPESEIDSEMEKNRLQNSLIMRTNEFYNILMEKANIIDNRGKFY